MRFRIEQRFGATVDGVEAAFTDPAFIESLAALPQLGRPQLLERTEDGPTVRTLVRYAFAGDLSSAVRRVVDPARLTWVEDATLDRAAHRSRFTILPDHYAALLRCHGTAESRADGDGSRRVTTGEIEVPMPLVGGKVERAIVSGMEEHAAAEVSLIEQWVAKSAS